MTNSLIGLIVTQRRNYPNTVLVNRYAHFGQFFNHICKVAINIKQLTSSIQKICRSYSEIESYIILFLAKNMSIKF